MITSLSHVDDVPSMSLYSEAAPPEAGEMTNNAVLFQDVDGLCGARDCSQCHCRHHPPHRHGAYHVLRAPDLNLNLNGTNVCVCGLQASRNERGVGQTSGVQREGEGTDLRMLVHQSQAGCIIGKGGLKVKELRDVSTE